MVLGIGVLVLGGVPIGPGVTGLTAEVGPTPGVLLGMPPVAGGAVVTGPTLLPTGVTLGPG